MENIAYYNGKISSIEEMTIPMNERSSYFGDGVYDAMFTVDHVPLQLDDHLRRFYRSAKKIDIDIPMPFEELRAMVLDFCRRIDSPDAMAYVQATRGVGMRNHTGVATKAFAALQQENINIQMISTSEIKISCLIDEKYTELAVRTLHDAFELHKPDHA